MFLAGVRYSATWDVTVKGHEPSAMGDS
ncbi:MAG: hypothetical protein RL580_293, partial [Pseudomonadota bacterium]